MGFWRAEDRILRRVSITGGAPLEIAPTDAPHIALWGSDGEIIIDTAARKRSLWSIPAGGGTPQEIHVRDRSSSEWWIWARALVPHGSDLLVASSGPAGTWLDVLSRQTGTRRRLVRAGGNVLTQYTRTGHIVYVDGDALFALPVDERWFLLDPRPPCCTASTTLGIPTRRFRTTARLSMSRRARPGLRTRVVGSPREQYPYRWDTSAVQRCFSFAGRPSGGRHGVRWNKSPNMDLRPGTRHEALVHGWQRSRRDLEP